MTRYRGCCLPDDDAGRADLWELLLIHSLHPSHPRDHMQNEIELSAPWLSEEEAKQMVAKLLDMEAYKRWALLKDQGERMGLTYVERERAKAWSLTPVGFTKEQLKEIAKQRARWRRKLKRLEHGVLPRKTYLEERSAATKTEPWKELGISRATWYRRGLHRETGVVAAIMFSGTTSPVSPNAVPPGEAASLPGGDHAEGSATLVEFPTMLVRRSRRATT